MSPLVCDTSGLLAALDTADPDHAGCVAAIKAHAGPFLLPVLVLAELDHLVRRRLGAEPARLLAEDVAAGAYDLVPLTAADVRAALELDRAYADLGLGLTDASLVVAAQQAGTTRILSLDERHLRAVRPLQGGALTLLPADGV